MQTAWDDPEFVSAWNESYGMDMRGAPIRTGTVYPWVEKNVGDFTGKRLIDFGCGNGNLINRFRDKNFKEWHGVDGAGEVLKTAAAHISDPRIVFTRIDAGADFPFDKTGRDFDVLTSVFVIEEIPNDGIAQYCRLLWSLLKPGGTALIFCNHPVNVVREDMLGMADPVHPVKFEGLNGYFDRRQCLYSLSILNQQNQILKKAPYFHKTVSDILNGFTDAGFALKNTLEIPLDVTDWHEAEKRTPQKGDIPRFLCLTLVK